MGKYYGSIGFGLTEEVETSPDVWEVQMVERNYYGDVLRNAFRSENSGNLNNNIVISNRISIVADPFALNNFQEMKYATYLGIAWKVLNVEEQFPRLILTLGDRYVK